MTKFIITEGGVAGHMNHLYDNLDLKFSHMKDIFEKASSGELVGTEKTDGQNIFLSYSIPEGKAKAARNKGNIKSGGLSAEELADKFSGRGTLAKAFNQAFASWEAVINGLTSVQKEKIFGPDADIWYNAEIQTPETANVINYDENNLVIHQAGHAMYDKATGNPKNVNVDKSAKLLMNAVNKLGTSAKSKGFKVVQNAVKNLQAIDSDIALKEALTRLESEISKYGISDNQTIGDYVIAKVNIYIDKNLPGITPESKDGLIKKIIGTKGLKITNIVKGLPKDVAAKIKLMANNANEVMKQIIFPIEDIVHDFSVAMLQGLESAFVLDNSKEVQRLKAEVAQAIKIIQNSNEEDAIKILSNQLRKLKTADNVSTAVEGFVFNYDGVTYKFTGNFAPINQILGLFRFGRGKIPPLKHLVKESNKNKIIGLIPGGYKPPHSGHFEQAKYFSNIQSIDDVVVIISPKSRTSSDGSVEITAEQSLQIWNIFSKYIPKLKVIVAQSISPVTAVYEFVETSTNPGDTIFLGSSEKDAQETSGRFRNMASFIDKKGLGITAKILTTPSIRSGSDVVSATALRDMIAKNDSESFISQLPNEISLDDKKKIWSIVSPANREIMFEFKEKEEYTLEEISAMSAGGVEGASVPRKNKKNKDSVFLENAFIDRHKLFEELELRKHIREAIRRSSNKDTWKTLIPENKVNNILKILIKEQSDVEDSPHDSTGINILEELLKKIIPILESGYKTLTTKKEQRESFRAHILNAVQKLLTQADITGNAGEDIDILAERIIDLMHQEGYDVEEEVDLDEIDVQVGDQTEDEYKPDDDRFIDIDKKSSNNDEEEDTFGIEGEDETGRNMAQTSFDKIENQIVDSYNILSADEDKKLFYDYLLANLKLYFDKFESELDTTIDEPMAGDDQAETGKDNLDNADNEFDNAQEDFSEL